jgi:hypothetical protein
MYYSSTSPKESCEVFAPQNPYFPLTEPFPRILRRTGARLFCAQRCAASSAFRGAVPAQGSHPRQTLPGSPGFSVGSGSSPFFARSRSTLAAYRPIENGTLSQLLEYAGLSFQDLCLHRAALCHLHSSVESLPASPLDRMQAQQSRLI